MTPVLHQWALRHKIPFDALTELKHLFGTYEFEPSPLEGESEAAVQTRVRLEASMLGMRLWRNNVGVLMDERGQPVRFGLANESKQVNAAIKSHDLIGIRPVLITPQMVGTTIGQFVSREIKKGSWTYTGTPHEKAQLKWGEIVTSLGGDAAFANRVGTLS